MLRSLIIENFAVIQRAEIDFQTGFNTITGETGAGKSLILNALRFALGEKIHSKNFLNPGKVLRVQLIFDLEFHTDFKAWLASHDYPVDDDTCTIRRLIDTNLKQKSYLNDQLTQTSVLREAASNLLQIHGQHDTNTLCAPVTQRQIIDEQITDNTVSHVQFTYEAWAACQQTLISFEKQYAQYEKSALLEYQLQELNQLALTDNEVTVLEQQHQQGLQREELLQTLSTAHHCLAEDAGLLEKLAQLQHLVNTHCRSLEKEAQNLAQHLQAAAIELEEADALLSHTLCKLENTDASHHVAIEQRLNTIYDLARKHRVPAKSLYAHAEQLQQQWTALHSFSEKQAALQTALDTARQQYQHAANALSQRRATTATKISRLINEQLQALGMQGALCRFEITPQPDNLPSVSGQDKIVFWLQTNPGHPALPLSQIASGGELSRISLAIQMTLKNHNRATCLFFDEIDTGVGGEVGDLLGNTLQQLGEKNQLICITHLPQIAARANHHLRVLKNKGQAETTTHIQVLTQSERIQELARMLGDPNRPEAIQHANALLS